METDSTGCKCSCFFSRVLLRAFSWLDTGTLTQPSTRDRLSGASWQFPSTSSLGSWYCNTGTVTGPTARQTAGVRLGLGLQDSHRHHGGSRKDYESDVEAPRENRRELGDLVGSMKAQGLSCLFAFTLRVVCLGPGFGSSSFFLFWVRFGFGSPWLVP